MPPLGIIYEIGRDQVLMEHVTRLGVLFPKHAGVNAKLELLNLCVEAWDFLERVPDHVFVPAGVLEEIEESDQLAGPEIDCERLRRLSVMEPADQYPHCENSSFNFIFEGQEWFALRHGNDVGTLRRSKHSFDGRTHGRRNNASPAFDERVKNGEVPCARSAGDDGFRSDRAGVRVNTEHDRVWEQASHDSRPIR